MLRAGRLPNGYTVLLHSRTQTLLMKYFPILATTQLKLKWEHRATKEKEWTEYPPEHSKQLSEVRHQPVTARAFVRVRVRLVRHQSVTACVFVSMFLQPRMLADVTPLCRAPTAGFARKEA